VASTGCFRVPQPGEGEIVSHCLDEHGRVAVRVFSDASSSGSRRMRIQPNKLRPVADMPSSALQDDDMRSIYSLRSSANRAMRTPGSDLARHVDYIFHLQSGLSSLLSHVSERQGLVYRGITALLNPEIYAVGKVITWQAFSSSTKAQLAALGFVSELPGSRLRGSMFVIQSVTAKDIRHFSAIPSEEEVLFPPNSQFKVETVATNEAEKKGLLDQLDAYDMTDLDVYTLKQIG